MLAKIEEKLPEKYRDVEEMKRIEEILRRNHIDYKKFDEISIDSYDDY